MDSNDESRKLSKSQGYTFRILSDPHAETIETGSGTSLVVKMLDASIPVYATLLYQGWTRRRQAGWHKRAMLSAMLVLVDPAIGRFPIAPPVLAGHAFLSVVAIAAFVPLVIHDRRNLGHLHPVTKLALIMVCAMHLIRIGFLATGAWAPIAHHLPGAGA